jgi:hypothetical protein
MSSRGRGGATPRNESAQTNPARATEDARQAAVSTARGCLQQALKTELREDAKRNDLYASDEVFRDLNACVSQCTGVLRSLGDGEDVVVQMILQTLDAAAAPNEPHPALRGAVEEWCRHAYRAP